MESGEHLSSKLASARGTDNFIIDFLFIDHDKSMYLPDLQELEAAEMIRRGTHVAADNVVFAQIDDYRNYMKSLARKGVLETKLADTYLEYSLPEMTEHHLTPEQLADGIELSVYLRDT
jgi:catechol O-methyltransferase